MRADFENTAVWFMPATVEERIWTGILFILIEIEKVRFTEAERIRTA